MPPFHMTVFDEPPAHGGLGVVIPLVHTQQVLRRGMLAVPVLEAVDDDGFDPVTNGIATIPNIAKITWISANERGCDWCRALNGRTWYSVEDFSQDKNNIIKPGVDNIHLAHPHCTCTVKVETTDGQVFHVDSAGIPG